MGDKGKGDKGVFREEDSKDRADDSPGSSFLSQVASSASGLARSAFTAPTSNELNESAAALSSVGKGHSSSSTGSLNWNENSRPGEQLDGLSSASNAFRPGHSDAHIKQSEEEFSSFLNGVPSLTPSEKDTDNLLSITSDHNLGYTSTIFNPQPTLPSTSKSLTVAEQEARDGEAVSNMLSAPGRLDDDHFKPPSPIEESINWGLSRDGLRRLSVLIKSTETTPDPRPLHASPVFEDLPSLDEITALKERHSELLIFAPQSLELQDVTERLEQLYGQWDVALKTYTDDIWGPDRLQEVMKESEEGKVEELATAEGQDKALRRLNAIWAHLRAN